LLLAGRHERSALTGYLLREGRGHLEQFSGSMSATVGDDGVDIADVLDVL
jgi:hypothetical protein